MKKRRFVSTLITLLAMILIMTATGSAETMENPAAIQKVSSVGFVDCDGAKVSAIILEYNVEILGSSVTADAFETETYDTLTQTVPELGENPGQLVRAYVNDVPETADAGKEAGHYVILEVNTDFMRGGAPQYTAAMCVGARQVKEIASVNGAVAPVQEMIQNYTKTEEAAMGGPGGPGGGPGGPGGPGGGPKGPHITYTAQEDAYTIQGIAGFELHYKADHPKYDAAHPAFQATNCFEEATGESVDVELPYALFVPADYDANQKYALVLMIEDAGSLGDDPMIALTEAQGPVNYASDRVQQIARDQGLGGIIVVAPQIEQSVRTTRDNYTVSAAVPATWQLIDALTEKYSIDMNRIYGSGQSMGGMQIMAMASQRDNYFAGQWYLGMQWGNNYAKQEPYTDRGETAVFFQSNDPTIALTDADGQDSDLGRNVYYLISDDNILFTNCWGDAEYPKGDAFSTGVWKELRYLYQDIAGVTIPQIKINPLTMPLDEQNEALAALLKEENPIGIYWQSFVGGGGHMSTWIYGHKLSQGYEWLLRQTRDSENARAKLENLNRPWQAETDADKLAAKQTEERQVGVDTHGNAHYYAVPAEGAGTVGYNSGWFSMNGTIQDGVHFPGWTPAD